jgi:hypothetical protein
MFGQPGQTSPTVQFMRTIDVMSKTGVVT